MLAMRMCVFPSEASAGFGAAVSFRSAPDRVVISLFNQVGAFLSTTTFLGGDKTKVGLWLEGPAGVFYLQDARQAGGAPQILGFAGTGVGLGTTWICMEAEPVGAGSDQDYDDAIVQIDFLCGLPVQKSSWGAIKQRFH